MRRVLKAGKLFGYLLLLIMFSAKPTSSRGHDAVRMLAAETELSLFLRLSCRDKYLRHFCTLLSTRQFDCSPFGCDAPGFL